MMQGVRGIIKMTGKGKHIRQKANKCCISYSRLFTHKPILSIKAIHNYVKRKCYLTRRER